MSQNIVSKIETFPDYLNAKHLVDLGLYQSVGAVYVNKKRGVNIPDFLRIGRKILYPKSAVIQFVNQNMNSNIKPNHQG